MKGNTKLFVAIGLVFFMVALLYVFKMVKTDDQASDKYRIGIFQIVRHPVLDTIPEGFKEVLDAEFPGQVEYQTMIPEGDPGKIEQMANMFATQNYNLVFVVGTNCAQSLAKKTKTIPIVLGAATDPLAAGLVDSWEKPGHNITGTSDLSPVSSQLDRLKELLPESRNIGIIYNPSEDNSNAILSRFKIECQKRGLTPVIATLSAQNEMKQTVVSLVGKVDALYAPTDATVQSAFDVLIKTANEVKIPVFNCDEGTAKKGALFSVGFNYKDLGTTSGEMAVKILKGQELPENMPIQLASKTTLFFNSKQILAYGKKTPASWDNLGTEVNQ